MIKSIHPSNKTTIHPYMFDKFFCKKNAQMIQLLQL